MIIYSSLRYTRVEKKLTHCHKNFMCDRLRVPFRRKTEESDICLRRHYSLFEDSFFRRVSFSRHTILFRFSTCISSFYKAFTYHSDCEARHSPRSTFLVTQSLPHIFLLSEAYSSNMLPRAEQPAILFSLLPPQQQRPTPSQSFSSTSRTI